MFFCINAAYRYAVRSRVKNQSHENGIFIRACHWSVVRMSWQWFLFSVWKIGLQWEWNVLKGAFVNLFGDFSDDMKERTKRKQKRAFKKHGRRTVRSK